MTRIIDMDVEQFPVYVKKDLPVTINYRLITDGTAPVSGERIRFGFYGLSTFLHASMPSNGATVTTSGEFTSITITSPQSDAWTTERTLTVLPTVTLDPSRLSQLCSIQYDPSSGYWPIYARRDVSTVEAIGTSFEYKAKWFDITGQSWIYSFDIVLQANLHAVSNWRVSFCNLPPGTKIHSELWADVKHDGNEGIVELATPGGDRYILEPGKPLPVSIQLRYPATVDERPELEVLHYLVAYPR